MIFSTLFIGALLKGFLIGLAIAAPVGPIALLCIKTTLRYGPRAGFATGAGAAFADTFWAAVGIFGVTLIINWLEEYSQFIRFFGGAIMIVVGCRLILSTRPAKNPDKSIHLDANLLKDFITSFVLTMSNPATIFAFIAVFAGLGIAADDDYTKAITLISGVLCGSLSWWYMLSLSVTLFKKKIGDETIHKINVTSGVLISLFGIVALLSIFKVFSF